MPWQSRIRLGLAAMMTLGGALALLSGARSDPVQPATAKSAVNHHIFLGQNGAVYAPALVTLPTAGALTPRAAHGTLACARGTATGPHRFGSCLLTVVARTAGAGPHVHDVIPLRPCDVESDNTLRVAQGNISAPAAPGTAARPHKEVCGIAELEQ